MGSSSFEMPFDFVSRHATLTWRELRLAWVERWIKPDVPIALAAHRLASEAQPAEDVVALACLDADEPVLPVLERLASSEPPASEDSLRAKWLYLALRWVYEHRKDDAEGLRAAEEIYADFGYPEEIVSFIAYMPSAEPPLATPEANVRRLYANWQAWLTDREAVYAPEGH